MRWSENRDLAWISPSQKFKDSERMMPISYVIDPELDGIHATATGVISPDEVTDFIRRKTDAGIMGSDELIDVRNITVSISATDLPKIAAEAQAALAGRRSGRTAVVTNSVTLYGLAQAYGVAAKFTGVSFRVFRDIKEARVWLSSKPEREA